MACAVVQSVGVSGNSVSSITTGAITTTTGNLLHVDSNAYSAGANAMAVTDSKGNTYAAGVAKYFNSAAFVYCQSNYAKNATGGASHTFTLSLGGSGTPAISVVEISGADTTAPLDLHESTAYAGANTLSPTFTTSGTTAQASEIAIACISENNVASVVVTEASGWSAQYDNYSLNLSRLHSASKVLAATGVVGYSPTFSPAAKYSLHITTYKAAASGSSYNVSASQGSFSESGQAAGFRYGRSLLGGQGSFAETGKAALFKISGRLVATFGSFTLNGQSVTFSGGGQIWTPVPPTSLTWTPQTAASDPWAPVIPGVTTWAPQ